MLLKRVGLDETNTTFKNQARSYLNMIAKELGATADWWWQYKQGALTTTSTLTVSSISGTFASGNTITGASSSRTATVASSYDVTNASTSLFYHSPSTSTDFTSGETVSVSGGASATAGADVVTRQYQLASDVLMPYSWRDETNDRRLLIASWDEMDAADADQDESGDARWVVPEGIDSSTGYQVVALYPLHSTSNETFKYRYHSFIPDWTSDDDSTALDRWVPQVLQPALIYGGAKLYKQEKGDDDGAEAEASEYDRLINRALRLNGNMWGNRRRVRGYARGGQPFNFNVQEGSLTA